MAIVVLAVLILGGVFGYILWRNKTAAAAAGSWPSVEGRITASTVTTRTEDGQTQHWPHVAYAYTVGGKDHAGTRVRFGLAREGLAQAKALCARYPVGSRVPVFYDPADPSRSVLERATSK